MPTRPPPNLRLPKHVHFKHGAYYYARWSAAEKKTVWKRLGETYAQMLMGLAEFHEDSAFTMADLLERYRRDVSNTQGVNTRRQRDWQLDKLKASFGKMIPESVTTRHVYRFLDEYGADAPVSANRMVSLLHRVFVKAIRWGYVSANPAQGVEKHEERPRRRYITDAEYAMLLQAVPPHVARAVELAYLTGQRVGDLISLKWGQVQADGIHLVQAKTGTELIIERSQELDALLERCRGGKVVGRHVLVDDNGQPFNYWGVANPFRKTVKALQAAGKLTDRITFHDLRRKAGSDVDADSELLGHLDKRTRDRVYRVKPKRAKPTR